MKNRSITVQRIYSNAAGEILRVDTITESGYELKTKAFYRGDRGTTTSPITNNDIRDYGELKFHSNHGVKIETETFHTTTSRVVADIDMIGGNISIGAAPNYQSFTWQYGTIDISYLPIIGSTV